MKKEGKLIEARERFSLSKEPDAYIISVHIQNLMATYGEVYVKEMIKDLFFTERKTVNKNKKDKVSNE